MSLVTLFNHLSTQVSLKLLDATSVLDCSQSALDLSFPLPGNQLNEHSLQDNLPFYDQHVYEPQSLVPHLGHHT